MPFFRRKKNTGFENRSSILSLLTAPFTALFGSLFGLLGGSDNKLGHRDKVGKRILRGCVQLVVFPFWMIFQVLKFIVLSWTTTRDGSSAFWGMIPMGGIMAVLAIVVASGLLEDRRILALHQGKANEWAEAGDYDTALVFSKRAQNISNMEGLKFGHALLVQAAGNKENAVELIEELAGPENIGYLPAHVYLAEKLMATPDSSPDLEANLADALSHVVLVINKAPDERNKNHQAATRMRPKILFRQGNIDKAMKMFGNIASGAPEVVPELAQYLIDTGDVTNADLHIDRGIERLREWALVNPNVRDIWVLMYRILMVRKDYEQAVIELNYGLTLDTNDSIKGLIMKLQSDVLVEFSRNFTNVDTQDGYRQKLIPVCQAMQRFPRNAEAIQEFVDLVLYPPNELVSLWLEEEAIDNVSPSIYHTINGCRHSIFGKPGTAIKHFNLAFNGDSRAAIVINDIALNLCNVKYEYTDALQLIDVAIETWRGSARLFLTRGEILVKMGRIAEALADLEYAKEHLTKEPRVLILIAECYETSGRDDEAVDLRRQAKVMQEAIDQARQEFVRQLTTGERS